MINETLYYYEESRSTKLSQNMLGVRNLALATLTSDFVTSSRWLGLGTGTLLAKLHDFSAALFGRMNRNSSVSSQFFFS